MSSTTGSKLKYLDQVKVLKFKIYQSDFYVSNHSLRDTLITSMYVFSGSNDLQMYQF